MHAEPPTPVDQGETVSPEYQVQPPKPEPSTAVTVNSGPEPESAPDLGGVGDLPPDARGRIALQRAQFRERLQMAQAERAFVAAASKITWARSLEPEALMKLAGWAREADLDLLTEFNILGGSAPYVNAKWYIRQLGALVAANEITYAFYDVVSQDARLDEDTADSRMEADRLRGVLDETTALDETTRARLTDEIYALELRAIEAAREIRRRRDERIKYQLPEGAAAAVVWHIKTPRMAEEVIGAQAVGGYRGKNRDGDKFKDPVGEEFPRETAITRGCRKAMLSLAHVGGALRRKEEEVQRMAERVAAELPAIEAESRQAAEARRPSMLAKPDGPYADD